MRAILVLGELTGAHVDQIQEDLKKEQILQILNQPTDGDLPGSGEFYCIHCA
jgi:bud site selection protein 20